MRMYFMQHSLSRRRRRGRAGGWRVRGTQGRCGSGWEPVGSAPFSAVLRVERESKWVLLV